MGLIILRNGRELDGAAEAERENDDACVGFELDDERFERGLDFDMVDEYRRESRTRSGALWQPQAL